MAQQIFNGLHLAGRRHELAANEVRHGIFIDGAIGV
jgi:hypothetical protein